MKEQPPQKPENGLNLNDIRFILFRQKGKIVTCALAGIVAAAVFYVEFPIYQSKAKLIVRYIPDRNPADNPGTRKMLERFHIGGANWPRLTWDGNAAPRALAAILEQGARP